MRLKLIPPFWLSINLNKGQYSHCLNPHIGFFWTKQTWDKGARGWMLCFPPEWPIWNIELNAAKRNFFKKRL